MMSKGLRRRMRRKIHRKYEIFYPTRKAYRKSRWKRYTSRVERQMEKLWKEREDFILEAYER